MAPQQDTTVPAGPGVVDPELVERFTSELLDRLGLHEGASNAEIEKAHDQRVDFLADAPPAMADWARREIELVDEAYALLCDPHADIAAAAADRFGASQGGQPPASAGTPGPLVRPARQPMARSTRTLLLVGLACALVFGVYKLGGGSAVPPITGAPTDSTSASAAPQVDQALVAEAMKRIAADPKDAAALKQLGDLYFQAGDYSTAATWYSQQQALSPRDAGALVALGAALYNSGDADGARKQWTRAVALEPDNAEAHYDLGFLAFSQDPPDKRTARAEWTKVIEIDPKSELAASVSTHLDSLKSGK